MMRGRIWAMSAAFVMGGIAANWSTFRTSLVEEGDFAADSLLANDAWRHTSGIFSRWDFHHPGPALLWSKWVGEGIAAATPFGHVGGHMIVILVATAVALGLLATVLADAGHSVAAISVFPVAALTLAGTQYDPWAPTTAHAPLLMSVAAMAALALGRRWALPVGVLAGLCLVHLHVLWAPVGVAALVATGVLRWRSAQRGLPLNRSELVTTAGIGMVMIAPLLVGIIRGQAYWTDYLTNGTSNPQAGFVFSWRQGQDRIISGITPDPIPDLLALTIAVGLSAVVLSRGWRSVEGRVILAGFALLGYLLVICRLQYLNGEVASGLLLPLLLCPSLTAIAVPKIAVRSALATTLAITCTAAIVMLPNVGRASIPSGLAEQVLERLDPADGPVLIDHATTPWDSYAPAAALLLLAKRNDIAACVVERRWPYWVESSDICESGVSGTTVMFVSRTSVELGGR